MAEEAPNRVVSGDGLPGRVPERQAPRQHRLDVGVPRDPRAREHGDVVQRMRLQALRYPVERGGRPEVPDIVVLDVEQDLPQERPRDDVGAADGLHRGDDEVEVGGGVAGRFVPLAEVDVDGGGAVEGNRGQGAPLRGLGQRNSHVHLDGISQDPAVATNTTRIEIVRELHDVHDFLRRHGKPVQA